MVILISAVWFKSATCSNTCKMDVAPVPITFCFVKLFVCVLFVCLLLLFFLFCFCFCFCFLFFFIGFFVLISFFLFLFLFFVVCFSGLSVVHVASSSEVINLHLWCNQAKSNFHFLNWWYTSFARLHFAENPEIRHLVPKIQTIEKLQTIRNKEYCFLLFGYNSISIFPSSDWFCSITSHFMILIPSSQTIQYAYKNVTHNTRNMPASSKQMAKNLEKYKICLCLRKITDHWVW